MGFFDTVKNLFSSEKKDVAQPVVQQTIPNALSPQNNILNVQNRDSKQEVNFVPTQQKIQQPIQQEEDRNFLQKAGSFVGDYIKGTVDSFKTIIPNAVDVVAPGASRSERGSALGRTVSDAFDIASTIPVVRGAGLLAKGLSMGTKALLGNGLKEGVLKPVFSAVKSYGDDVIKAFSPVESASTIGKFIAPIRGAAQGTTKVLGDALLRNPIGQAVSLQSIPMSASSIAQGVQGAGFIDGSDQLFRSMDDINDLGFSIQDKDNFSEFRKDLINGNQKYVDQSNFNSFEDRIEKYGYQVDRNKSLEERVGEYNSLAMKIDNYKNSDKFKPATKGTSSLNETIGGSALFGSTVPSSIVEDGLTDGQRKDNIVANSESEYSKNAIDIIKSITGQNPKDRDLYAMVESMRMVQDQKKNLFENINQGILEGLKKNPDILKEKSEELKQFKIDAENKFNTTLGFLPFMTAHMSMGKSRKEATDEGIKDYMKAYYGITNKNEAFEKRDQLQNPGGQDLANQGIALKSSVSLSSFGAIEKGMANVAGFVDKIAKGIGGDKLTDTGLGHLITTADDTETDQWLRKMQEKSGETAFYLGQTALLGKVFKKVFKTSEKYSKYGRVTNDVLGDMTDNAAIAGLTAQQTDNLEYLAGAVLEAAGGARALSNSVVTKNPKEFSGDTKEVQEKILGDNIENVATDLGVQIADERKKQLSVKENTTPQEVTEKKFLESNPTVEEKVEFYQQPIQEALDTSEYLAKQIIKVRDEVMDISNPLAATQNNSYKIMADLEGSAAKIQAFSSAANSLGSNISVSNPPAKALQAITFRNEETRTKAQSSNQRPEDIDPAYENSLKQEVVLRALNEEIDSVNKGVAQIKGSKENKIDLDFNEYSIKANGVKAVNRKSNNEEAQRTVDNQPRLIEEGFTQNYLTQENIVDSDSTLTAINALRTDLLGERGNNLMNTLININKTLGVKVALVENTTTPLGYFNKVDGTILINQDQSATTKRIVLSHQLVNAMTYGIFTKNITDQKSKEYKSSIEEIHGIFMKKLDSDINGKKLTQDQKIYLSEFSDVKVFAGAIFDGTLISYMQKIKVSNIKKAPTLFQKLMSAITKFLGYKDAESTNLYGLFFKVTETMAKELEKKTINMIQSDIKKQMIEQGVVNQKPSTPEGTQENIEAKKIVTDIYSKVNNQIKDAVKDISEKENNKIEGMIDGQTLFSDDLSEVIVNPNVETETRSIAKAIQRFLGTIKNSFEAENTIRDNIPLVVKQRLEKMNQGLTISLEQQIPGDSYVKSFLRTSSNEVLLAIDSILATLQSSNWIKKKGDKLVNTFHYDKSTIYSAYMRSIVETKQYDLHNRVMNSELSQQRKAAFIIGRALAQNVEIESFDLKETFEDNFALEINRENIKDYFKGSFDTIGGYVDGYINDIIDSAQTHIQANNVYRKYMQAKNKKDIQKIVGVSRDPLTGYIGYLSSAIKIMRDKIQSEGIDVTTFQKNYVNILKEVLELVDPGLFDRNKIYVQDMLENYSNVISNIGDLTAQLYQDIALDSDQVLAEIKELSGKIYKLNKGDGKVNLKSLNLDQPRALRYFNIGLVSGVKSLDMLTNAEAYPVEIVKQLTMMMGLQTATIGLYSEEVLGGKPRGIVTSFLKDVEGTVRTILNNPGNVDVRRHALVNELIATQAIEGKNLTKNFYLIMRDIGLLDTEVAFAQNDVSGMMSFFVTKAYQDYKDAKANYITNWKRSDGVVQPGSVVFLIGKSGAGKSVYASSYSNNPAYLVITIDKLIPQKYTSGTVPKSVWKSIFEEAYKIAAKGINENKIVIFDATNLSYTGKNIPMERLGKISKIAGVEAKGYGLIFDIDDKTRIKNLQTRDQFIPESSISSQEKSTVNIQGLEMVNSNLEIIGKENDAQILVAGMNDVFGNVVLLKDYNSNSKKYKNKTIIEDDKKIDLSFLIIKDKDFISNPIKYLNENQGTNLTFDNKDKIKKYVDGINNELNKSKKNKMRKKLNNYINKNLGKVVSSKETNKDFDFDFENNINESKEKNSSDKIIVSQGFKYINGALIIDPDSLDYDASIPQALNEFFVDKGVTDYDSYIKKVGDLFNSYTQDLIYMSQFGERSFSDYLLNQKVYDFFVANNISIQNKDKAREQALAMHSDYINGVVKEIDESLKGLVSTAEGSKKFHYNLAVLLGKEADMVNELDPRLSGNKITLSQIGNKYVQAKKVLDKIYGPEKLFNNKLFGGFEGNKKEYILTQYLNGAPMFSDKNIDQNIRLRLDSALELTINKRDSLEFLDDYNKEKLSVLVGDDILPEEEIILPYKYITLKEAGDKRFGLKMVFELSAQKFVKIENGFPVIVDILGRKLNKLEGGQYRLITNQNDSMHASAIDIILSKNNDVFVKQSTLPSDTNLYINQDGSVDVRIIKSAFEGTYQKLASMRLYGRPETGIALAEKLDAQKRLLEGTKLEGFVNNYMSASKKELSQINKFWQGNNAGKYTTYGNIGKNNTVVTSIQQGSIDMKDYAKSLLKHVELFYGINNNNIQSIDKVKEAVRSGLITNQDVLNTVFAQSLIELANNTLIVYKKVFSKGAKTNFDFDAVASKEKIMKALLDKGYYLSEKLGKDVDVIYKYLSEGSFKKLFFYEEDGVNAFETYKENNSELFTAMNSIMSLSNNSLENILAEVDSIGMTALVGESSLFDSGDGEYLSIDSNAESRSYINRTHSKELKMLGWLSQFLDGKELVTKNISQFKEGPNYINISLLAGVMGRSTLQTRIENLLKENNPDNLLPLDPLANTIVSERKIDKQKLEQSFLSESSVNNDKSKVLDISEEELLALSVYDQYLGLTPGTTLDTVIDEYQKDPDSDFTMIEKKVNITIGILNRLGDIGTAFYLHRGTLPNIAKEAYAKIYKTINPSAYEKIGANTMESITESMVGEGTVNDSFLKKYGYLPNIKEFTSALKQFSKNPSKDFEIIEKLSIKLWNNLTFYRKKLFYSDQKSDKDLAASIYLFMNKNKLNQLATGQNPSANLFIEGEIKLSDNAKSFLNYAKNQLGVLENKDVIEILRNDKEGTQNLIDSYLSETVDTSSIASSLGIERKDLEDFLFGKTLNIDVGSDGEVRSEFERTLSVVDLGVNDSSGNIKSDYYNFVYNEKPEFDIIIDPSLDVDPNLEIKEFNNTIDGDLQTTLFECP